MQGLDEGASDEEVRKLMTFMFRGRSEVASMLDMLVEAVDDICNREHHGFLEAPLEAYPPLGVEVLMKEAIKDLCTQQ